MTGEVNIRNKKAGYEFELIEKMVAGMQLWGTEIKSLREGKASLNEAYCYFRKEELWVKSMHIAPYSKGTHYNHEPMRERKLLLKKGELRKLEAKVKEKGYTIVPVRVFISKRGYAKMEVALAKGKKVHDKRKTLKEKELKREIERGRSMR